MPGPAPKKNARRRNARPDWVTLPAYRTGRPPGFPIVVRDKDGAEYEPDGLADLWRQLWATPQATQWSKLGWHRTVARYALLVLQAESPRASAILQGEVRQLEDRLGLSPLAMKRLQWEVADAAQNDEEAPEGASNVVDLMSRMG
jgi:hypothetical protein